jgi:hypothetical protein
VACRDVRGVTRFGEPNHGNGDTLAGKWRRAQNGRFELASAAGKRRRRKEGLMRAKVTTVIPAMMLAAAAIFLASIPAISSPKRGQIAPSYTEQRMNELYQVMTTNVSHIYEPVSEIERWQANVAMWHLVLQNLNDPQNMNISLLKDRFQLMQTNVFHITQNAERDRWDDNVELWQLYMARLQNPTMPLSMAQFNETLGEMDANVCCIAEPGEHERWQANHDMWQLMVARMANQAIARPVE